MFHMTENQTDATPPAPPPPDAPRGRRRTHPVLLVLMGVIPAAVIGWLMYQNQVKKLVDENRQLNSQLVYNLVGQPGVTVPLKLAERFQDADGDLVADAPKDPKQLVDPPTL